jgi:hypothetical protein
LSYFFKVADDVETLFLQVICREDLSVLVVPGIVQESVVLVTMAHRSEVALCSSSEGVASTSQPIAGLAEHFLRLCELYLPTPVGAREVEVLVAALSSCTRYGGPLFTAERALLVAELFLLLVEVQYLTIVDVKDFVGPQSATGVDVHVELVGDQPTSDGELAFLPAKKADQSLLRIEDRRVFTAADH